MSDESELVLVPSFDALLRERWPNHCVEVRHVSEQRGSFHVLYTATLLPPAGIGVQGRVACYRHIHRGEGSELALLWDTLTDPFLGHSAT